MRRGHVTLANSLAMKLNNVTDATPAPEGGDIDRDAQGRAIGWFREGSGRRMVMKAVPPPPPTPDAVAEKGLIEELAAKLPLGITSLNVAGMRPNTLHWIQSVYEKHGADLPRATVQLRLSPGFDSYDDPEKGVAEAIREVEGLGYRTGFGDDRLKIGAIKMSIDGGFSAAAFMTLERYPSHKEDYFGVQRISQDVLYRVSKRAYDLGWQLGIHAIGDGAVKMTVETLARVQQENPRPDARLYMHHVSVMPPEDTIALMERYKIAVASQPNFTYSLGPYNASPGLSPARLQTNNPQATLIRRNIQLSYGSDGMPYGPLVGIYAAVTRKGIDGKVYGPQEKVAVREAVRMYTLAPAWLNFDDDTRGSLEVGKVGDLVVLGEDILAADPERIKDIPVEMTVVGGKVLYTRPPAPANVASR
jgi:predicted amidohydrolase YtcJ